MRPFQLRGHLARFLALVSTVAALAIAYLPTAHADTRFQDGFETGLGAWTQVRGVSVQSADVWSGAAAAEAVGNGAPAYVRKALAAGLTDLEYSTRVKLVSQGANAATLMVVRTDTGSPVASLFVNPKGKLAVRAGGTVTTSPVVVSNGSWHAAQLDVHIAGNASQIEVTWNGTVVPALTKTLSLGTLPVRKIDLGEAATGRYFTTRFDDVALAEPTIIDTTPPSAPSELTATATSAHRVDLSWSEATDDVGVTAYEILRDGQPLATVEAVTSFSDATAAPLTTYGYQVRARDGAGNVGDLSPEAAAMTQLASVEPDPLIAAAGDIACPASAIVTTTKCRQMATSDLLVNKSYDRVLTLGDNQYNEGTLQQFTDGYAPSWGRVLDTTSPSVGNHEYLTAGAAGYFDYFGNAAGERGRGYYSYNVGAWHVIALNSNCAALGPADGCVEGTPQNNWLEADLAASSAECTLAYFHHPFLSTGEHGNIAAVKPFWDDLYAAGADVVLGGHSHNYERFTPVNPDRAADSVAGLREFVVGTGGRSLVTRSTTPASTSEVRNYNTFGVLQMTLRADTYRWTFIPEAGATFTDSGSAACH